MNKLTKIIISIVFTIITLGIYVVIVGVSQDAGRRPPGILVMILFGALYGGLRAMWKRDKNKDKNNNDKNNTPILQ